MMNNKSNADAVILPLRANTKAMSTGNKGRRLPKTEEPEKNRRRRRRLASSSSSSTDENDERDEARDPQHDRRGGGGRGKGGRSPRRQPRGDGRVPSSSSSALCDNSSIGCLSKLVLGDRAYDVAANADVVNGLDEADDFDGAMDDGEYEDLDGDHGLVDVGCPSWDLLNQDSFGFNLLGSQGSLSFDTDHHHNNVEGDVIVDDKNFINDVMSTTTANKEQRCCGKSIDDLTSAVTASLDADITFGGDAAPTVVDWEAVVAATTSTPKASKGGSRHNQRHQQQYQHPCHGKTKGREASTIVSSVNHNWKHSISPLRHSRQQQQHHDVHYHQHYHGVSAINHSSSYHPIVQRHSASPSYFFDLPPPLPHHYYYSHPPPLRESRSDVTPHSHCYYNNNNNGKNDTIWEDDNSTARMGNRCNSFENNTNGNNEPASSSRDGSGDRIRDGDRRSKKRKQDCNSAIILPQAMPSIDEKRNPSSTIRRQHDKSSTRDGPFLPSTCIGGSSGATSDTIHSAFLPPVPMMQGQPLPPSSTPMLVHLNGTSPPSPLTSAVMPPPCRDDYITTNTVSSSIATKGMNGKTPSHSPSSLGGFSYAHHPRPPYNYHAPVVSKSQDQSGRGAVRSGNAAAAVLTLIPPVHSTSGWTAQAYPSSENHNHHQATQRQQQKIMAKSGIALLMLPDGKRLSRAQAPGIGWTSEEDARLTEVMSNHKSLSVDWEGLSVEHGSGRTARECHDRWTRYLRPGSRKGQWTEEEDAIVLRAIFSSGGFGSLATAAEEKNHELPSSSSNGNASISAFTQWADLAPQLPGRTGKQIRDRWVNYLNPAINHLPFSRDDDLRLWRGHKELGKRWVEISVKVFQSTRSENHIKNRWYSAAFKKFISKEFGVEAYNNAKQSQGGDDV
ncbi:hypothetical protein ACHAXA_002276 [Cyclostephanos tholiformis]|uniref:Uncharacterized protein n=1 Tax=Cyclostephanos tholiformis TaxID=382380 RepID=A0ABD3RSC2_9STRA